MIGEFPLFIFTLLGGAAAGAYVLAAVFPLKETDDKKQKSLFPLVALILLAVSGLMLLTHLGHPERMLNAFSNPSAGITQEGFTMMGFGVMVVIDLYFAYFKNTSVKAVKYVAAVFAFLLLLAMGNTYFQMLGEPACATAATIPFFVVGNLGLGAGLLALFMDEPYTKGGFNWTSIVIYTLLAVTLGAMALHFSSVSLDAMPMWLGLVVAGIAPIVVCFMSQKETPSWAPIAICALVFIGMAIARYAFYATL